MPLSRRALIAAPALLAAAVAGPIPSAALARPAGDGDTAAHAASYQSKRLAAARKATVRFRELERAKAAGYVPAGPCVAEPGLGGMGIHYMNPQLLADPKIDLKRPENLLYLQENGRMRLIGVEYMRADADQNLATAPDRPRLFGRAFDGPMAGHGPGQPIHFDLHVWLHRKNPSGMFNPFNPKVRC